MAKPPADCAIATCERKLVPPYGRGMCSLHYQRWRKYGDPEHVRVVRYRIAPCAVDGCDKPMIARDWCSAHWTRWQRHGSPDARLRGEVLNGCRVCPACEMDIPISQYTAGKVGPCRDCLARRKRVREVFNPVPPVPRTAIECHLCGATFMGNGRQSKFCSPTCLEVDYGKRAERRKQRLMQVEHEKFSRTEIFTRDEWVCGICAEAVDPEIAWPDRMCAVMDHVIPVAKGGTHMRVNVQTAHNVCNARKGARL